MKVMTARLSWKPIRKGGIYCAPACGGGCKWDAYQKARRDAAALAKKLGPGWKPRLNENLGWHWSVFKSDIEITRYEDGLYRVGILGGTPVEISVRRSFKDPLEAIRAQIDSIESEARHWVEFSNRVKNDLR